MMIIPYPLELKDSQHNLTWHPYTVHYTGPDGLGEFHIYAISEDHAHLRLQDVKESAKVIGRVLGFKR